MQLIARIWASKIYRYTVLVLFNMIGAVYGLYFYRFGGLEGSDPDRFGTFGDYVGGVLNPLLSSATIILLVLSFRVQSKQLAQASRAHDAEVATARDERRRQQLEEFASYHLALLDRLYDRKIFYSPHGLSTFGVATGRSSIRDLCGTSDSDRNSAAFQFLMQLSDPHAHGAGPEIFECVVEIKVSNELAFKLIMQLFPLVASLTIRSAWRDRILRPMKTAFDAGIIGESVYKSRVTETMRALLDAEVPLTASP